jgi:carbohydrate kinase (thermoresistant glucokinase family)
MGVSGSGKTTIGQLLASKLGWPFFEGDDFHSPANVKKMTQGTPLTDEDREGWLTAIAEQIKLLEWDSRSAVIACSALKDSYRKKLSSASKDVKFVFLRGDYDSIRARLESRVGHYMKSALLQSQFDTLEEPENSLDVDIKNSPEKIVETIIQMIEHR